MRWSRNNLLPLLMPAAYYVCSKHLCNVRVSICLSVPSVDSSSNVQLVCCYWLISAACCSLGTGGQYCQGSGCGQHQCCDPRRIDADLCTFVLTGLFEQLCCIVCCSQLLFCCLYSVPLDLDVRVKGLLLAALFAVVRMKQLVALIFTHTGRYVHCF